jgi:hypothetical protein
MKQALVSLIRTVVRVRGESVNAKVAVLPELSSAELRQVTGGALDAMGPKGTW